MSKDKQLNDLRKELKKALKENKYKRFRKLFIKAELADIWGYDYWQGFFAATRFFTREGAEFPEKGSLGKIVKDKELDGFDSVLYDD